jgi:hypothetical protein
MIIFITILLLLGACVYLFLGQNTVLNIFQVKKIEINSKDLHFIRNYLPDFIWCFSLSTIHFTFISSFKKISITPLVFCISYELLQIKNYIFKGTFDWFDILTYVISYLCAIIYTNYVYSKILRKIVSQS